MYPATAAGGGFNFTVIVGKPCEHLVERNVTHVCVCIQTHFIHKHREKSVSHLPDPDNSVGDEDKKNDNGLHKGGGCLLSFLKQSQHLHEHTGHITLVDI